MRHRAVTNILSSRSTSVNATLSTPCSSAWSARVSSKAKNFKRRSGSFSAARIPPNAQVSNDRRSRLSRRRPERSSNRPTDSGANSAIRPITRSHSLKASAPASRRAACGAATNSARVALRPAISAKLGANAASAKCNKSKPATSRSYPALCTTAIAAWNGAES